MSEERQLRQRHRGMPAQKRVLAALVGSSVLVLSTQYMFWRTVNPFQSGVDEVEFDHKMWMLLQEEDNLSEEAPQQHAPHTTAPRNFIHHGMVHHRYMPSNPGNKSFCLRWTTEDAFNRTMQLFDYWWVGKWGRKKGGGLGGITPNGSLLVFKTSKTNKYGISRIPIPYSRRGDACIVL